MSHARLLVRALASAMLATDEWTARAMVAQMVRVVGETTGSAGSRKLVTFARAARRAWPEPPLGRYEDLVDWLAPRVARALRDLSAQDLDWPVLWHPTFDARMNAAPWPVPALATPGAIAGWLGLDATRLEWFADTRRTLAALRPDDRRAHYRPRWIAKRDGRPRLVEAPKPRLRAMQRRILREVLEAVPAHPAAHGFVRGRSMLTHAAAHVGRAYVLRLDLADFFPSVRRARVFHVFLSLGYPAPAARVLADLCTTRTPARIGRAAPWPEGTPIRERRLSERALASPHLPQGAPTSPALANLCANRLDVRLSALAARIGATYTRYADDLVFSGDAALGQRAHALTGLIAGIALDEGFTVRLRKTHGMPASRRQVVTGIVVNTHPNVRRSDFDRLKAVLTNCIRHGPTSQNREGLPDLRAHLTGRVAFVRQVNPARGAKLQALLDRIDWAR